MEYLIPFWIICGVVGYVIASAKNAGVGGFFLGLLLGPLGVLAAFTLDFRTKCLACKAPIDPAATICPHCRTSRLPDEPPPEPVEDEPPQQIHFKCKSCRTALTWPASEGGNRILCTECGEPNTVPDIFNSRKRQVVNVVDCPDCGGTVSRRAETCPHCGCPVASQR